MQVGRRVDDRSQPLCGVWVLQAREPLVELLLKFCKAISEPTIVRVAFVR